MQKSFKDRAIVDHLSFEVKSGEIMAILGPNGAGKSTTIRQIMGIIMPDAGHIQFAGCKPGDIPRSKIGYLPEERGLYKNVKVMDVLLYLADLKDYPRAEAERRALAYLERFDLKGKENVKVEELSKGMAQKVQFIGSVLHEPNLLILDEPFSGLDPVSQDLMKKEVYQLAESGTAILLSSHQMNIVEELCDRLLMIHRGKEVIYDSLSAVKHRYANFKCTIRGTNDEQLLASLPAVRSVSQRGEESVLYLEDGTHPQTWLRSLPEALQIEELKLDRISLHEIFISVASDRNLGLTEQEGENLHE